MTLIEGGPSASTAPTEAAPNGPDATVAARRLGKRICLPILGVYFIAFALPVFQDTGLLANHLGVRPHGSVYGWHAFLVGFFMQRTGWFANLAIWTGVFFLARRRPLLAATAGAVAIGLGSMYLTILADHSILSPRSYSVGYFCWLGSAVLLVGVGLGLGWLGPGRGSLIFAGATAALGVTALIAVETYIVVTTAPPTQAALADRLITGDAAARRAAARKLAIEHKVELLPAFIQAAQDPDDKVRQYAISAIGDVGPAAVPAVPTLIAVLKGPLGETPENFDRKRAANSRSAAAAALGNIGPAAKEAIRALATALKDENIPVRRWSATSLGEMRSDAHSAIPVLLGALADSDPQVRRYAIQSLQKIGPSRDIAPSLANALHDADPTVREAAGALLESLGNSH
jgi:HEAT repeat protein